MKKRKIVLIITAVLISVTAYSLALPGRTEIQEHHHKNLKSRLGDLAKEELQNFCLLQDLRHADRLNIPPADSDRYVKECDVIGEKLWEKMKTEHNSKGEEHSAVFMPEGKGDKERTRDFVVKNCSPEVSSVFDEVWEYAERNEVKGSVPFVIAHADSQCGKVLSTPNNPGNVGNNDRGNRVGFMTMADGMEAIVDTLNNDYLGSNSEMWQLSEGGRTKHGSDYSCENGIMGYKCYASSVWNWRANTSRALVAIYGGEQDDMLDFKFRIK